MSTDKRVPVPRQKKPSREEQLAAVDTSTMRHFRPCPDCWVIATHPECIEANARAYAERRKRELVK